MPLPRRLGAVDEWLASGALLLMLAIPLLEIVLRPLFGHGVENAPILVQHLGLVLAMFGALLAERGGHLTSLGSGFGAAKNLRLRAAALQFSRAGSAIVCGMLALASWRFVATEMDAPRDLAYGVPGWVVQAAMPVGFLLLGVRIASRMSEPWPRRIVLAVVLPAMGFLFARQFDGSALPLWPFAIGLAAILACGAPVFAVLGGLALALFWQDGQPLAAVPLSHYQITVNPSLPALPLFTLAGLLFA
jgi:TRAP-type C4-dicarboxylate transport system permease small subunit